MPKPVVLVALLGLLANAAGLAQTQDPNAQTLHEILTELRAIHQDMRVTQTTQLLIAQLEIQQGVVNRATEKMDDARNKLNDVHFDQKRVSADLTRAEEQLDKAASVEERNALTQDVDRAKSNLAELALAERDRNSTLQDLEQRLQNAEDKLAGIESELTAALSRLAPISKDAGQK